MPTFNSISGAEPSTTSFRVATVTMTRNSTLAHQEILSIGDPDTTNALAAVLNTTPGSTAWALAVREVAPSTTVQVSSVGGAVVVRSSAANALVSVYQSTAADLNVTVAGYSTTAAISSVSGRVATMPLSTLWASSAGFHFDSSGALQTVASFTGSTTVVVNGNTSSNSSMYLSVRLTNGTQFLDVASDYIDGSTYSTLSGAGLAFNNGSNATFRVVGTTTPLPVREYSASSLQSTTTIVTSSNSTAVYALISSVAGNVHKVHGYFVGCSTSGNPSTLVFMSSLAIDRWSILLGSGYSAANMVVNPPSFIFRTDNQNALNCRIESASTAIQARISLAWVTEP